jgi:ketosteroid isomerase-like protein
MIGVLFAAALAAAPSLTDASVRAFVARQERAWNAGDLAAYFALYAPDARFADQARTPGGQVVPYGSSTVAQARAQARKFRATAKVRETGQVLRVEIAPDGRSARVVAREVSVITTPARARTICAERVQTVVLRAGALRSTGQTDTVVKCPR